MVAPGGRVLGRWLQRARWWGPGARAQLGAGLVWALRGLILTKSEKKVQDSGRFVWL